jgi:hypothetical protein
MTDNVSTNNVSTNLVKFFCQLTHTFAIMDDILSNVCPLANTRRTPLSKRQGEPNIGW